MPKRFIVAPDSFKGTLSSSDAATAMAAGIRDVFPDADIQAYPMADGGEGSSLIAGSYNNGERVELEVSGPEGQPVLGFYYRVKQTVFIELAAASGFSLSRDRTKTARFATTFGTGELIRHAIAFGAVELNLFLGGSATTDGGVGMSRALGAKFFDAAGNDLPLKVRAKDRAKGPVQHRGEDLPPGEQLSQIVQVTLSDSEALLAPCRLTAIVDVDNPLCGPRGAAHVYGPQKGLTAQQVEEMDQALGVLAARLKISRGRDDSMIPGAGAAGEQASVWLLLLGGSLVSGSAFFLDLIGFAGKLDGCDAVITGEGQVDSQSLQGKLLGRILEQTAQYEQEGRGQPGLPTVFAICGKNSLSGVPPATRLHIRELDPQRAMTDTAEAVRSATDRALRSRYFS